MDEPATRAPEERDTSTMVFLSLFLLVLAFFILLTSLSEVNEQSGLSIIQAVRGTFGGDHSTNLPSSRERLESEVEAVAQRLSADVKELFDRDLPGSRTTDDDQVLLVRMPQDELFSQTRPTVRRNLLPLVRQVADLLADPPPGIAHRLELSLPDTPGDPAGRQFAVARLGHLAAAFTGEGAVPEKVSVVLRPPGGDGPAAGEVQMRIYTFLEMPQSRISFAPPRSQAVEAAPDPAQEAAQEAAAGTGPAATDAAAGAPVVNLPLQRDAAPAGAR